MSSSMPAWEYLFSGHVQGVGFRYTAQRLAQRQGLRGTVENLGDGRVRIRVAGQEAELGEFIDDLRMAMSGNIAHIDRQSIDAEPAWNGFQIIR